ncbi:MAG: tetrahydrofolate dehydrogenase/cyclohydrolase catalytic domain-containing protein [Merdibacter sp.]
MQIINGKAIAQEVKDGLCRKIETLRQQGKRIPKLSVVLIGTHAASATYAQQKSACAIGMESDTIRLPETITQEELLAQIEQPNEDPGRYPGAAAVAQADR